jgi:hypothetical protein
MVAGGSLAKGFIYQGVDEVSVRRWEKGKGAVLYRRWFLREYARACWREWWLR